jgi:hypothetical protein
MMLAGACLLISTFTQTHRDCNAMQLSMLYLSSQPSSDIMTTCPIGQAGGSADTAASGAEWAPVDGFMS